MGHDGYVIGDENLGFIIRKSKIFCNMVLVVIILYFIVISMIIFTIINSLEMYCAIWNQ
jgi:hypothetical protein